MDDNLFKAVLSMDAYNRGYGEGIQLPSYALGVTKIGNAIISTESDIDSGSEGVDASFYAIAYTYNGEKIIAYRGTDYVLGDLLYGWEIGVGVPTGTQARLAFEFYQAVAGDGSTPLTGAAVQNANISLTGHSLGGGLAGLVGSLYNRPGTLFDTMAYQAATQTAYLHSVFVDADPPTEENQYTALKNTIYGSGTPWSYDSNFNNMHSIYIDGEVLDDSNRFNQKGPQTELQLSDRAGLGILEKHDMALLVIRMFAETLPSGLGYAESFLLKSLFNNDVAIAAGANGFGGQYLVKGEFAQIMRQALAYSVIDEGDERVFGDTGIRALLNDANDLGDALNQSNINSVLTAYDNLITRVISDIFTQYAGQVALGKIKKADHAQVLDGVLTLSEDKHLLTISLKEDLWEIGRTESASSDIYGLIPLFNHLFILHAGGNAAFIKNGMSNIWGTDSNDIFERIILKTTTANADFTIAEPDGETQDAVFLIASTANENITGSSGKDLIYGAEGEDILSGGDGDDILVGGAGHDVLYGNAGRNVLIGGTGSDTLISDANDDILDGGIDPGENGKDKDTDIADYSNRSGGLDIRIIERQSIPSSVTASDKETDIIVGIERINFTDQNDAVELKLLAETHVRELHFGGGDDKVTVNGSTVFQKPAIYLGAGNDTLDYAPRGSVVYGEGGEDHFNVGKDWLIADAGIEDILFFAGKELHGGIRHAGSEILAALGVGGIKYYIDVAQELVIENIFGDRTYVSNYTNNLNGQNTAGIKLIELDVYSRQIMDTGGGARLFETFEALMGHALKALTGRSYFATVDPLVLDLDGDGIELNALTSIAPMFDVDGDGFAEHTGWVRGDDGVLARDLNGNGTIDDIGELFGNATETGFEALAALDDNEDGVVDANDAAFASLSVWKDSNGNAVTDDGELLSLAEAGIVSFNVTPGSTAEQTVSGNIIRSTGSYMKTDGSAGAMGDVLLHANQRDTRWLGDDTIDSTAANLPEVKGYGTLNNLRIAMTDSPELKTVMQNTLPNLNTLDLSALRLAATPILFAWMDAVAAPEGTPGMVARSDVPILTNISLEGGVEVLDFAFTVNDSEGTYWKLGSGAAVRDANDEVIDRPTLGEVMAQMPGEGAWTTFSGEHIQFMERYSGNAFPLGVDNLTGAAAINGAGTILDYMWTQLNEIVVRLAMQGPLAPYFDGVEYNVEDNNFLPTTDKNLVTMLEAIFNAAPGDAAGAIAHLNAWSPILDIFLQDFDRGEDYLLLSYGYLFQNVVAAYENVGLAAPLAAAAEALNIPTDLIHEGAGTLTGSDDADLFYLGAGDQIAKGGVGPDTYVIGRQFGHDVIEDEEPIGGQQHPDMLRFAHLNAADVTLVREELDLMIYVNGSTDSVRVFNQFIGKISAPGLPAIDPEFGISEIVFANGEVYDLLEIARQVATHTDGDDTLIGTRTIDFLDGGSGNDYLEGQGEGDVYSFGYGDGQDVILDAIGYIYVDSPDIVQFKPGVGYDDVILSRDGNALDLIISLADSSDTLTILRQFDPTYTGPFGLQWMTRIEAFYFADGRAIYWDEVFDKVLETLTTTGDDVIYGFARQDTLNGGAGNDFLSGGNENDIYLFGFGDGHDTIHEKKTNILSGGIDTLRFKQGVTPADVTFTRDGGSLDLLVSLSDGSTVTIVKQFDLFNTGPFGVQEFDQIERFEFADGIVLTVENIMQAAIDGNTTDGDDIIYGFYRQDILEGGLGDDYLAGAQEKDVYRYSIGDGNDTILDTGGIDELHLLNINPGGVKVERSAGTEDAIIRILNTNETITLKGQLEGYDGVGKIIFADSTVWQLADIRARQLSDAATDGDDTIIGYVKSNDLLDGGTGNDYLEGRSGGDTYYFGIGYGEDIIYDYNGIDSTPDTVIFGAGITKDNITLSRVNDDDLMIRVNGTDDTLTIIRQLAVSQFTYHAIEHFLFADGTSWTQADVATLLTKGTDGDDVIYGTVNDDVMEGKQGNDDLYGSNGSDTYIYNLGDGDDRIFETNYGPPAINSILFGSGITSDIIHVGRSTNGAHMTLTFDGYPGSVYVEGEFSYPRIQQIIFGDGEVWDEQDIRVAYIQSITTSGDDVIVGFEKADDILQGGLGNDWIEGLSGSDTYIYHLGDGDDIIIEGSGSGEDILILGEGITVSNLHFARSMTDIDDVTLTIDGYSGSILLNEQFGINANGIETIQFADNTQWTEYDLRNFYLSSVTTDGNDTIIGFEDGDDTLAGGAGDDTLHGLLGNDTYVYNIGDGHDTIEERTNYYLHHTDTLMLGAGLNADDLVVTRSQQNFHDLTLSFIGQTGSILLKNQFNLANNDNGVEQIVFGDGTLWDKEKLVALYQDTIVTDGNDIIYGFHSRDDILVGGKGDDTLYGLDGADTYLYNPGDGHDTISEYRDYWTRTDDTLIFGAGLAPSDLWVEPHSGNSNDVTIHFAGYDGSVTINAQFSSYEKAGIEIFEFADGTVWNKTDLQNAPREAPILSGTTGNDTLVGTTGNDILHGGLGNDWLEGLSGADSYLYNLGDGDDIIFESHDAQEPGDDTLIFGSGITPDDIWIQTYGYSDVTIHFSGHIGEIIITDQLDAGEKGGIEIFKFSDGTVWNKDDLANAPGIHVINQTVSETVNDGGEEGIDALYGNNHNPGDEIGMDMESGSDEDIFYFADAGNAGAATNPQDLTEGFMPNNTLGFMDNNETPMFDHSMIGSPIIDMGVEMDTDEYEMVIPPASVIHMTQADFIV